MDFVAAIIEYLKQDDAVKALVGNNIYGLELPASLANKMPCYAVLITPSGGNIVYSATEMVYRQRMDVRCYGSTGFTSTSLMIAVNDAIKRLYNYLTSGVMLYNSQMESGISIAREPSPANWLFNFSVWAIFGNLTSFEV